MTRPSADSFEAMAADLIGVVDLRGGVAVHAVAGNRSRYQNVLIPNTGHSGDPLALIDHYRSRGLQKFYFADLDALTGKKVQFTALSDLICHCGAETQVMIDVGFRGDESSAEVASLRKLADLNPLVSLIVASESVASRNWHGVVTEIVPGGRVVLSLDYRDGVWLSDVISEREFLSFESQAALRFGGAIVLDIARVGTGHGVTTADKCRELIHVTGAQPQLQIDSWISGGGIRTPADVRSLLAAGCQQCLVATALL